jgi:hypothetical protein
MKAQLYRDMKMRTNVIKITLLEVPGEQAWSTIQNALVY